MNVLMGVLLFITVMLYGLIQIYAGFLGIELYWGTVWAAVIIAFSMMTRITIPIMIGGYFCATEIWNWDIIWAVIFVMPSILFMIPAFIAMLINNKNLR